MDDPIFDPWAIGEARQSASEEPSTRRWIVPKGQPTPMRTPLPRPKALQGQTLQSVARPRLEEVQARLQIAGHGAVLADLTDREPPSLRFRLVPRRGAFDEVTAVEGAVLELTWDDEAGDATARFWLDPLVGTCTEAVMAPYDRVDVSWVDRVVLDFVAKTLRPRF